MRPQVLALLAAVTAGCSSRTPAALDSADPAFEARWTALTGTGAEILWVGDERGEALMGNVRRTARRTPPRPPPATAPAAEPAGPDPAEIQQVIRSNLPAVRGCYLGLARQGTSRSGKAIVTFAIGPDGRAADVKIDAPSFEGTKLPGCLASQISFWSFPKTEKGAGVVSYPFVFVGG